MYLERRSIASSIPRYSRAGSRSSTEDLITRTYVHQWVLSTIYSVHNVMRIAAYINDGACEAINPSIATR